MSMRCDFCGEILVYKDPIIYTKRHEGELIAGHSLEKTETIEPVEAKYHPACYERLREQDPSFPLLPE
jgi:hypothetical protein